MKLTYKTALEKKSLKKENVVWNEFRLFTMYIWILVQLKQKVEYPHTVVAVLMEKLLSLLTLRRD